MQDIEIMEDSIYDVKVAFKMDYRTFKKGEIVMVIRYTDEESKGKDEEFCIFSPEIK